VSKYINHVFEELSRSELLEDVFGVQLKIRTNLPKAQNLCQKINNESIDQYTGRNRKKKLKNAMHHHYSWCIIGCGQ